MAAKLIGIKWDTRSIPVKYSINNTLDPIPNPLGDSVLTLAQAQEALQTAFEEAFGRKTVLMREGGSIPVAVDFQEAIGAPLMISGIGQADAAVHSPNEHLLISQYHTGIEALIRFMCRFAESGTA